MTRILTPCVWAWFFCTFFLSHSNLPAPPRLPCFSLWKGFGLHLRGWSWRLKGGGNMEPWNNPFSTASEIIFKARSLGLGFSSLVFVSVEFGASLVGEILHYIYIFIHFNFLQRLFDAKQCKKPGFRCRFSWGILVSLSLAKSTGAFDEFPRGWWQRVRRSCRRCAKVWGQKKTHILA